MHVGKTKAIIYVRAKLYFAISSAFLPCRINFSVKDFQVLQFRKYISFVKISEVEFILS